MILLFLAKTWLIMGIGTLVLSLASELLCLATVPGYMEWARERMSEDKDRSTKPTWVAALGIILLGWPFMLKIAFAAAKAKHPIGAELVRRSGLKDARTRNARLATLQAQRDLHDERFQSMLKARRELASTMSPAMAPLLEPMFALGDVVERGIADDIAKMDRDLDRLKREQADWEAVCRDRGWKASD